MYYVGAASGGVWKSTDGGHNWQPIFDAMPAQSIGAIAIAPSDHNIVWVGTGETFIRSDVSLGDGAYRSLDAGRTWTHMGLDKTGRIGRIQIDPRNPDIVFACALGTGYGPQQERGVYRTMDGGKNWERVLFADENTGCSELSMDPGDGRTIFAGMWPIVIHTWGRDSGGPNGGVYVSRDGGSTWTHVTGHGLPPEPIGKVAVAVAPSDSNRVYALIETGQRGSLWRSDDGGRNWHVVNYSRLLNERPHYYTRMLVMPRDENEVYFPSNGMGVTYDGGETAEQIPWMGDNHDMWADPTNGDRIMIGHDLGVSITTTHGKQWNSMRLPIGQMYHVATDTRIPYDVYGQMQDYASLRGPSNSRSGSGIHPSLWTTTAGCETGWNIPDPVDPDIVWGGCYSGVVERFDLRTHMSQSVSPWPERTMGAPAKNVKLRMNWTFPIAISPFDHNTVYAGSQYVHATHDGGRTWQAISPDLTLNDKSMQGDSGGLTLDNLSVEYAGVVFAIAESPKEKGQIWAGTNDGQLQVTRDGGADWTNVTANLPGLFPKMTFESIEPSRYDAGTCYVAVDGHQVDNFEPWLYETTDYGRTWKRIVNGIPKGMLSYTHVLREDPVRRGLLYAGTENGLYVSFDDGGRWEPLQNNLPHAPVYWLTIQEHFNDLVVGTYGRGYWILDDVTPLQQFAPAVSNETVHLFKVRDAYRFRTIERRDLAPSGTSMGRNPAYGASITYFLKAAAKTADVTIAGPDGTVIRTLHAPTDAGVNRLAWDLRYEPSHEVKLRTTPPGNPHIWEEKRFKGKDWRPIEYYGINETRRGPLVAPGTYTVKLTVDGRSATQPVTVLKDPNSGGTDTDVAAATRLWLDIYHDVNTTADMINQIEWTRKQIEELQKALADDRSRADVVASATALDRKLQGVEDQLMQKTLAEGDLKSFRGAIQLYLKYLWLTAEVGAGAADVSGNADLAPTQPELEVYKVLADRLKTARDEFTQLYQQAIPAFNEQWKAKGVSLVTVAPR